MGGRTLATGENVGDLAALTWVSPGTPAVVFPAAHDRSDLRRAGGPKSQVP